MLSCSTCWNAYRHQAGDDMLREIVDLGFEAVELGHGVRLSLMEGIQRFVDAGGVKVSSLHNFCPLPVEFTRSAPDCYQFSSYRHAERERAIRLTLQTVDFAKRMGAPRVVLHLGSVPMRSYTEKLIKLATEGRYLDRKYVKTKLKAVRKREKKGPFYIERVKECLARVVPYAAERGITLGIEGRFAYEEIPNEVEIPQLLDDLKAPNVGYWHDFGHIQVKENLGFLDHAEWLRRIAPRLVGAHLHDTIWPDHDHQAPFMGQINYDTLVPILPPDTLFVWEMSPRRKPEEIVTSLARWKDRFKA